MKQNKPPKTIVFDLDGTLLDTWPSLLAAVLAFDPAGQTRLDPGALKLRLSDGIGPMLSLALTQLNRDGTDAAHDFQRLSKTYENNWLCTALPFEGSQTLLQDLNRAGYSLGLCTNRDPKTTTALLDHLGWNDCFQAKIHLGDCKTSKPSAEPLLKTLALLESTPDKALFIGDSHIDASCAANANVSFVAHLGGYHTCRSELDPCLMTFTRFRDLASWISLHHPALMES